MAPAAWEAEKVERSTFLNKKKDIVQLPSNVASGNVAQFKGSIVRSTVKRDVTLVVGKHQ
jgi:hypothetical protein